jgi:hypothetical protein
MQNIPLDYLCGKHHKKTDKFGNPQEIFNKKVKFPACLLTFLLLLINMNL